jgi:4-amino-4-deoxy-L-arabinose transferase-like glycosyltransferase
MASNALTSRRMSNRPMAWEFQRWTLVVLILLAFGRGVWALGEKSLWWDESLSLHRAQGTLLYALSNQIILTDNVDEVVTIDNHPPLYFALLWGVVQFLGRSEFALRYLSLMAVVLLVPLLYVTGRRLVDEWAGLVAAALGALSPMYLWYGQEARMYTLVAFLSLLSFYLFLRVFVGPSQALSLRHRWRWLAAYILVSACLVSTHYLGALLIAFQLVVLGFLSLRHVGRRRVLGLTISAVVVISGFFLAYAWFTRPRVDRLPGFEFIPLPELLRDLLNSFSLGLSVDVGDWVVFLIDLVFLLFLFLGLVWLVQPGALRKHRNAGWLLAGYLFFPVALIYLLSFFLPVYMNSRHLILISPAFYLLVAVGLTRWRRRMAALAVLASLLMIGGVGYSTYNYFYNPAYGKDHHREWGAYLREQVRPRDVVVVNPPHIADLYEYYASSDVPWIGLPLLNGSRAETEAKLEALLKEYDRVWLALSQTPPWGDRRRVVENWLNENAFRVERHSFKSYASRVLVARYLPGWPSVSSLPDDAHPLEVRFTPQLRLVGYRTVSPPESGRMLHVELFWAIDDYIPQEASVLLRLVDEQGHLWGEAEQCPFNALYPMWQWQPGLILRDEHEVLIAPGTAPGSYELELGLISRPTEGGCAGPAGGPVTPITVPPEARRGDLVLLGTVDVQRAETQPGPDDLGVKGGSRARFDGLALLGAEVIPAERRAGERLHVTLYWQAEEPSLPDAQFRLRLVDSSGETWQEALIRPVSAAYPADRWLNGERYRGQFWMLVPEDAPDGRYWLELLPEPPLRRSGAWATLRRWLGREDAGVRLSSVDVEAVSSSQPIAPIPTPTDLAISVPMLATLGDRVRFLGYDLDSESVPVGDTVSLTLYWQALSPMEFSYSVFTHLLGSANEIVGQKDGVPQDGAYPTTLWEPGEVITDTYIIGIHPDVAPGTYPLEIGMYRPETGVRLAVIDATGQPLPDDRILLSEISVLPAPDATPAGP